MPAEPPAPPRPPDPAWPAVAPAPVPPEPPLAVAPPPAPFGSELEQSARARVPTNNIAKRGARNLMDDFLPIDRSMGDSLRLYTPRARLPAHLALARSRAALAREATDLSVAALKRRELALFGRTRPDQAHAAVGHQGQDGIGNSVSSLVARRTRTSSKTASLPFKQFRSNRRPFKQASGTEPGTGRSDPAISV